MSMEEIKSLIEAQGKTFEEFKSANDKRIEELEKKGHASAETVQVVEKLNADLTKVSADIKAAQEHQDELEKKFNRPGAGGGNTADVDEHKTAFDKWFRKGEQENLEELEKKALNTQSDPDGGFMVPEETDSVITRVLTSVSAMRRLARVVKVGSATYKKLHNVGGASSGWVGEESSRPETGSPQLKQLDFPTKELYSNPAATQSMLDDASFDVAGWLAEEVAIEFAEQEGEGFILGVGVNDPRGILSYPAIVNASYTWGKLGFTASGAAGAFVAAPNGGDCLIDLQHSLKSGYRANGKFMMNDLTLAEVRKLKDSQGAYLWRAGLEAGAPETLLGKPVETDDNMPDIAANSLSIAFGDFRRGYVITDRMGARVLRDPYTNKPFVHFYTTKRVGGGVQDFAAIKLLKFAA